MEKIIIIMLICAVLVVASFILEKKDMAPKYVCLVLRFPPLVVAAMCVWILIQIASLQQ